jgi:hypothetical protein
VWIESIESLQHQVLKRKLKNIHRLDSILIDLTRKKKCAEQTLSDERKRFVKAQAS